MYSLKVQHVYFFKVINVSNKIILRIPKAAKRVGDGIAAKQAWVQLHIIAGTCEQGK